MSHDACHNIVLLVRCEQARRDYPTGGVNMVGQNAYHFSSFILSIVYYCLYMDCIYIHVCFTFSLQYQAEAVASRDTSLLLRQKQTLSPQSLTT